jgi:hypothetical protein
MQNVGSMRHNTGFGIMGVFVAGDRVIMLRCLKAFDRGKRDLVAIR